MVVHSIQRDWYAMHFHQMCTQIGVDLQLEVPRDERRAIPRSDHEMNKDLGELTAHG